MTLNIFSLVLDGEPFVREHLTIFEKLSVPFHWAVAEGVADNVSCTRWCAKIPPRLSRDGTTEYLHSIRNHPNVTVLQKQLWPGKLAMCNACVATFKEPGVLIQQDIDEFFSVDQLEKIVKIFKAQKDVQRMEYRCNYFVGPDIVVVPSSDLNNNRWRRAWRYAVGQKFDRHEPPVFDGNKGKFLSAEDTEKLQLVFNHYAYKYEHQAAFKAQYYQYRGAVAAWRKLQANTSWPCKLRSFLPWAHPHSMATRISA